MLRQLSAGVIAVILLAGCSSPKKQSSLPAAPTTAAPASPIPPPAGSSDTPPPGGPSSPGPGAQGASTPPPGSSADVIGPVTTLRGTVISGGRCVILSTGAEQWLLLGDLTRTIRPGMTLKVRGSPVAVPADCVAEQALRVDSFPDD